MDNNNSICIEDITETHDQPREPVKKALENLCYYDRQTKMYTGKEGLRL